MKKEQVDKMTLQEALDYAVTKIVEQGGQCLNGLGSCAYGDKSGKHCGVGWLLDADKEALMDYSFGVGGMVQDHTDELPQLIIDNEGVFTYLQKFHDAADNKSRMVFRDVLQRSYDIDTETNLNWQKWIDMGTE